MATAQEILDLLARIDVATSAIAARIQALIDQLNNATGGLSAVEAQQIADQLSTEVTTLESMGHDPNNPV